MKMMTFHCERYHINCILSTKKKKNRLYTKIEKNIMELSRCCEIIVFPHNISIYTPESIILYEYVVRNVHLNIFDRFISVVYSVAKHMEQTNFTDQIFEL